MINFGHQTIPFLYSEWLQCRQDGTRTDDAIVPSTVSCSYLCYFVYVLQFPVWRSVFAELSNGVTVSRNTAPAPKIGIF